MRNVVPVALAIGFFTVLIWLLASVAWTTSRGAAQMPLYSAYRFDPYGSAALVKFLRASGQRVTLLTHPILPVDAAGVLVNVTPPFTSGMLENYSTGNHYNPRLLRWITAGNTLIDFTQNATGLTDHFKLRILGLAGPPRTVKERRKGMRKKKRAASQYRHRRLRRPMVLPRWLAVMQNGADPHKLTRWIQNVPWNYSFTRNSDWPALRRNLQLLAPAYLIIPPKSKHWRILAQTKFGPVAIERPLGRGRVVFVGSPWPVLNGGIGHVGNLDFLRTIIGNKPVILDQWSLGVGHNYTTLDLVRRYGLMPALLELILLLMAYAWSCRGYPSVNWGVSKAVARSSVEQIAMLGRLYESSLAEPEIFQRVEHEIKHRIALALRCRADQITERVQKQPDAVGQFLRLILVRLQTMEQKLRESSGKSQRRRAARQRILADLMTQSWKLAKEINRGGHPGSHTAANYRSVGRGAGGNKEGYPRAGIID